MLHNFQVMLVYPIVAVKMRIKVMLYISNLQKIKVQCDFFKIHIELLIYEEILIRQNGGHNEDDGS